MYDLVTFCWETINDQNFLNAKCFKISTCDPLDDVIDQYACITARVAHLAYKKHRKSEFLTTPKLKVFFHLLCSIFTLETALSERMYQFRLHTSRVNSRTSEKIVAGDISADNENINRRARYQINENDINIQKKRKNRSMDEKDEVDNPVSTCVCISRRSSASNHGKQPADKKVDSQLKAIEKYLIT